MNFMNRKKYVMSAAETYLDVTADVGVSNCGWLGVVHYKFASSVSGDLSLRLKQNGETAWSVLATVTPSSKTDLIWTGNQILQSGDVLRIGKEIATACTIWISYVYEPWGVGSWQEFLASAAEASSSSSSSQSSESSSSESSSSSSISSESSESSSSSSISSESSESSSSSSISSESSSSTSGGYSQSSESSSSQSSESSESSSSQSSQSSESSSSQSSPSSNSSSSSVGHSSNSSSSSQSGLGDCKEIYTASGFATPALNGLYGYSGLYGGKGMYSNGTYVIWYDATTYWAMSGDAGDPSNQWVSSIDTAAQGCPDGDVWISEDGIVS